MKSSYLRIMMATVLVVAVGRSYGGPVTGDPAADGWNMLGNSKELGTYVRGSGDFDFTLYTRSFNLDADDATTFGGGWQANDLVLGIGAMVAGGSNLDQKVRIVAKFGAADAAFSPSSTLTTPGDGQGSSSVGGVGAIQLETRTPWTTESQLAVPANAGTIFNYTNSGVSDKTQRNGSGYISNSVDVGRLIFKTDNTGGLLSSLEVYLNVSALERGGYSVNPAPGDAFVLALQQQAGAYRDALGATDAVGAVPEPSSLVLAGLGAAAGLVVALRRRASR
jgi:hypothetical protein